MENTIDIFGPIEDDGDFGVATPAYVAQSLAKIQGGAVTVRLNSFGGDAVSGLAIFNLLKQSGKKITLEVFGLAASAASLIAMAGNPIRFHAGALFAIHNAWMLSIGDHVQLRKAAGTSEKISDQYAAIYAARSRQPLAKIKAMMDAETMLDAAEAKALGFCDEIVAPGMNSATIIAMAQAFTPRYEQLAASLSVKMAGRKPAAAATTEASRIAALRAAMPGASADFILSAVTMALTVPQAVAMLERHAIARQTPIGAEPLKDRSFSAHQPSGGDPIETFKAEVESEMAATGKPRHIAWQRVCRKNPDLRAAMVAQHAANNGHPVV